MKKGSKHNLESLAKMRLTHGIPQAKCVCLNCGIEFETDRCEVKRYKGKFCCKPCEAQWRKGKPRSEEIRLKISLGNKGKPKSQEHCAKISRAMKGHISCRRGVILSEEIKEKIRIKKIGKKLSPEHIKKIRCNVPRGPASPLWKGGRSFGKYCPKFNRLLKINVRNFFGNECALCGKSREENNEELSVHHVYTEKASCCESRIKEMKGLRMRLPPHIAQFGNPEFTEEEIMYIRMMVPICRACHGKMNSNGERDDIPYAESKYRKFFTELILTKYGGHCYTNGD